jgi:hypothetical protein
MKEKIKKKKFKNTDNFVLFLQCLEREEVEGTCGGKDRCKELFAGGYMKKITHWKTQG